MTLFELLGKIAIDNSGANKSLDDTGKKGKETEGKLSKAFKAVGKGAVAVGKTVATGLGVGAAAMAGLTIKALNLSGELEQNMGGSEAVFGEYAEKMQKTAKTAFSNMGLSTSDFLATANKMGALFQGAGFSIQESSDLASDAMQRAADVASIMGLDTSAAMEAIAGAAKGNFTMMDNLGVAMNDTTIQAYALSKGIKKSTSEMTNQEKIGLAMEMFMEKTSYAAGNYAKENETLAGSLSTAKAALTNFLDGSGTVEDFVSSLSNLANVVVGNLQEIVPRLTGALPGLIESIIPIIPGLVQSVLPGLVEGAVALLNGLAQILPELAIVLLDQIPVIIGSIRSTLESEFPQLEQPFAVIEGLFNGIWESMQIVWDSIGKPIFDAVSVAFSAAREALQPFIDAFSEYVTEGGFAEDATAAVTAAVDALKTAYEAVSGFISGVVDGFKDAVTWGKEHETALTMIGIAIGTVTAAIGAYNVAMAIKKAGGIAEIAQLGILQVQMWGLQVAEVAHTAASWVAATATTAFGAAMSFLTSPITLVVLAIGALIAIVVLCVKHWDDIKLAASNAWEWIKETWSKVATWFDTNVIQPVIGFFQGLWQGIQAVWDGICNAVSIAVQLIASILSAAFQIITLPFMFIWENCKEYVFAAFEWIKNAISAASNWISELVSVVWGWIRDNIVTPIVEVYQKAQEIFDNLRNAISEKITAIRDKAKEIFDSVKEKIITPINNAKEKVVNTIQNLRESISEKITAIRDKAREIFDSVKEKITTPINNAKVKVVNTIQNLRESISEKITAIRDKAKEIFESIKEKMSAPIEKARDTIKGIVDKIKGFFTGMNLEFPKIKMPHFGISPSGWKIGDLMQGSIPKLSIDWYAKAMGEPMIMTRPTIFGYNGATGELMGGGEAGSEVVSGTNTLMNMIQAAVAAQNDAIVYYLEKLIEMLARYFPEALEAMRTPATFDPDQSARVLAVPMNRELGRLTTQKGRGR
jgi:phage-related protein